MSAEMAEQETGTFRAHVRRAEDFRVEMPHQPGQAHRSAAGWTIDYRLQEITGGAARAISTVAGHFIDKPAFGSPWHYHDCDLQVGMVLEGSIELGYEADSYARAGKGDLLFIPGHVLHDVSNPSADYQVAEITLPGSFGTTEAAMPAPGIVTPARTWGSSAAMRAGSERGVISYAYPVAPPYSENVRISRERRSRTEPFEAGAFPNESRFRFMIMMQGWRGVELDGARVQLGMGDLLVIPAGGVVQDMAASDDFEAIIVDLLQ